MVVIEQSDTPAGNNKVEEHHKVFKKEIDPLKRQVIEDETSNQSEG